MNVDVKGFWEKGYLLIRGVFSREEIAVIREGACKTRDHKGDLLSNPCLGQVMLDDRVLEIAAQILGSTPVYFGDGGCSFGEKSHGYHKDNADRNDGKGPDWNGKYTLIRFGIYLQDHFIHSGGLNVREGSHNLVSSEKGTNIYLRTHLGDLVVWNMRTSHSGNGRLLRIARWLYLEPRRADRLPRFLFSPTEGERIALFFSFGLDDQHLERYIKYLKTRTYMVESWRSSQYSDQVRQAAQGKPVIVRDVWSEIKEESGLGLNESYAPIPY